MQENAMREMGPWIGPEHGCKENNLVGLWHQDVTSQEGYTILGTNLKSSLSYHAKH